MNIKRLLEIPKGRLIKKIIGFDEIYTVAIRRCGDKSLPQGGVDTPFIPIEYSEEFWYADPILFSWQGSDYLFVEEYDRRIARGQIAVSEINGNQSLKFKTIINEAYHMSFPMVFEWNGELYMIPETSANHSINIYHAESFPYKWKCVSQIETSVELVDTIVLEKDSEKIILLSSEVSPKNSLMVRYQKFVLYYKDFSKLEADETFNIKQIFNLNDRNAGEIVNIESEYILPTQEGTEIDYGIYLAFRKTSYLNKVVNKYSANDLTVKDISKKNILGIHTYSKTENYEIIDLRYFKFAPRQQYQKIFHN